MTGCITSDSPSTTIQDKDSDQDGWTNLEEEQAGTDPYNKDTDGDGYNDPVDPNPLVPQTTAPPSTTSPPTQPPTTAPPATLPPSTTPPTTVPPTTMAPPDFPDLSNYVYGFENYHSSDSTCCRTGDIIGKISDLGAQTVLYEDASIDTERLDDLGIQVLVFGLTTDKSLTSNDINQLYQYILDGGMVWLAAVTPGYDNILDMFGTSTSFVSKTEVDDNEFICSDEDWISYDIDSFYVASIYTFENLETWDGSIHVQGYGGYHEWPQVVYKKVGDGHIFCSNMAFYKYYHKNDNLTIFNNIAYTIASLI